MKWTLVAFPEEITSTVPFGREWRADVAEGRQECHSNALCTLEGVLQLFPNGALQCIFRNPVFQRNCCCCGSMQNTELKSRGWGKGEWLIIDMFSPSGNAVFHGRRLCVTLKWNWDIRVTNSKAHTGCGGADDRAEKAVFPMPGSVGLQPQGADRGGRQGWGCSGQADLAGQVASGHPAGEFV